eukprot:9209-Heterococcus_DN1.PRE.3
MSALLARNVLLLTAWTLASTICIAAMSVQLRIHNDIAIANCDSATAITDLCHCADQVQDGNSSSSSSSGDSSSSSSSSSNSTFAFFALGNRNRSEEILQWHMVVALAAHN